MSLAGKVAIVTGAGRGVGRAVALGLAREGASVVAVARTRGQVEEVAAEASRLGAPALAVPTDVTDEQQIAAMLDTVDRDFGRVDVLVNNAGGGLYLFAEYDEGLRETLQTSTGPPFWLVSREQWSGVLDLDLTSVLLCSKAVAARYFVPQRSGVIVNCASGQGLKPVRGFAAYGAAKAAVIHLTRIMAAELKDHNVAANVLSLPLLKTSLTVGTIWEKPAVRAMAAGWCRPEVAVPVVVHLAAQTGPEPTGEVIDPVEWNEAHGLGAREVWLAAD